MPKKIVLAYSGGLDTSVIIPWLKNNYNCEVIAVTVDVGQPDDFSGLENKAIQSGASQFYLCGEKENFVANYCWTLLKSGAIYERKYLLGTISRPLIAQALVDIAQKENADAICHGATGKGNDQVRFELAIKSLAPNTAIIAPWRTWEIRSRSDAIQYAKQHNVPITATKENPYSVDENAWYTSHEGGVLEDPRQPMPDDILLMTKPLIEASDSAEVVEIEFKSGVPVKLNSKEYSPLELLTSLNNIAAKHGIGVVDIIENRLMGMKSRGVYEVPGGTVLYNALQCLESVCVDKDSLHYKHKIALDYANLIYNGQWFSPLKKSMDCFFDQVLKKVSGVVKLKLFKGNCFVQGVFSDHSLYDSKLATFEADELYDQQDAAGFINIYGLPLKVQALKNQQESAHE